MVSASRGSSVRAATPAPIRDVSGAGSLDDAHHRHIIVVSLSFCDIIRGPPSRCRSIKDARIPRMSPYAFLYAISAGLAHGRHPKRTAPAYHDGGQEPAATGSAPQHRGPFTLPVPRRHGFTLTGSARPPRPRPGSSSRSAREGQHKQTQAGSDGAIEPTGPAVESNGRMKEGGGRYISNGPAVEVAPA